MSCLVGLQKLQAFETVRHSTREEVGLGRDSEACVRMELPEKEQERAHGVTVDR